ncbi:MAG TPA: glycine cleavage system protein GcvH [Sporichthyaceae bacterium]|nr:glycine cleavage system protein GcvH [Sporichthyaceae bacterium]
MTFPTDRSYTAEHEWALAAPDGSVRVGITDHAQEQLGDIVFVSLPEVGATVAAGEPCGELESTKSVSDLYAPVSGVVAARNEAVVTAPELINSNPYDKGWMFDVTPSDPTAVGELLSAGEYANSLEH